MTSRRLPGARPHNQRLLLTNAGARCSERGASALVLSPRALVLLTVVVALGTLASSDVLRGKLPRVVEAASGVVAML